MPRKTAWRPPIDCCDPPLACTGSNGPPTRALSFTSPTAIGYGSCAGRVSRSKIWSKSALQKERRPAIRSSRSSGHASGHAKKCGRFAGGPDGIFQFPAFVGTLGRSLLHLLGFEVRVLPPRLCPAAFLQTKAVWLVFQSRIGELESAELSVFTSEGRQTFGLERIVSELKSERDRRTEPSPRSAVQRRLPVGKSRLRADGGIVSRRPAESGCRNDEAALGSVQKEAFVGQTAWRRCESESGFNGNSGYTMAAMAKAGGLLYGIIFLIAFV